MVLLEYRYQFQTAIMGQILKHSICRSVIYGKVFLEQERGGTNMDNQNQANARVMIIEKLDSGDLLPVDDRVWSMDMLAMMEHANFLLVNGKEYEMIEGRLNVNEGVLEILVLPVDKAEMMQ
jgi:hypothetical protein